MFRPPCDESSLIQTCRHQPINIDDKQSSIAGAVYTCILVWLKGGGCVGMDQLEVDWWKDSRVHLCWRLGWETSVQTSVQFMHPAILAHILQQSHPMNRVRNIGELPSSWFMPMRPPAFDRAGTHVHSTCNRILLCVCLMTAYLYHLPLKKTTGGWNIYRQ